MTNPSPPKDEALAKALELDNKEVGYLMYRLDILSCQFERLMRKNPHTFDYLAARAIALNKPTPQDCYWTLREAGDYLIEQTPEEELQQDLDFCESSGIERRPAEKDVFFERD